MDDFVSRIKFVGNSNTNFSGRRGFKPIAICNHMSDGSVKSVISHFTDPKNKKSSAHFLVGKDGTVYQFVPIRNNAWANGLDDSAIDENPKSLIKKMDVNPNWYTVSIEHELYRKDNGVLTEAQKEATINLHKYIIWFAREHMQSEIVPDREHIFEHKEIDPVRKPFCAGDNFPIDEIVYALKKEDYYTDIRGHWCEDMIRQGTLDGWLVGYEDETFRPDNNITRAEVVAMLSKLKKSNAKMPTLD